MESNHNHILKFSGTEQLVPQEERLEKDKNRKNLTIGVPVERSFQENRVSLAPQAVGVLIANGHRVLIESGAGKSSHFSDNEFSEVGAQIVYSSEEVFKSDIILKVAPVTNDEIELLTPGQTLISSLHFPGQDAEYFKKLMLKKITAVAFEHIQDKTGTFPVIRSMSELVGTASIFIAAEYLGSHRYGRGSLLGGFPGITPTEVVILGAGTVAEYAARAALGLGAVVKVLDNSVYRLRRLQNILNTRIFTTVIQPKVLLKSLVRADVVIGAKHVSEGMSTCIVSEEMVSRMKKGSVIIDVSIDQGGCFETSRITDHNNPVYRKYDVTHYCIPNIPSKVPHTASYALSNFFTPVIQEMGEEGGLENMLKSNFGVRRGLYLFNGILTKKFISERFGLPFQDIELLMASIQ